MTATADAPTTATRTEGPLTKAQTDRETAIREYDELLAVFEDAKGKGDKKLAASASASASIRSARIHQAELEMAIAGTAFEPWEKPVSSSKTSRRTPLSQTDLQASLDKVAGVYHGPFAESTKVSADQRITALLKSAAQRGYQVKDPR